MYIPKEIKVRVQSFINGKYDHENKKWEHIPQDTPLGFLTFIDEKGKLRKEVSWNGWGDKDIGSFSNEPTSGFKMESTVTRSREWFGTGRTMFRIIHPSNFKFEITANNLNEICLNHVINKGVIEDKCVIAWDGLNLSLIPTSSEDYLEHTKHTEVITNGIVKPSELVIGKPYQDRNGRFYGYYLGKKSFVSIKEKKPEYNDYYYRNSKKDRTFEIKYNYSNLFAHYYHDTYTSYTITKEPKVYNNDAKYLTEVEVQNYIDKVHLYGDFLIPDSFKGEFNKEKMEEFIKNHKYYKECVGYCVNHYTFHDDFKWKTFPSIIK